MATPLDQKEIVATQELAICNMFEIKAAIAVLVKKGIVPKDEVMGKFKKLDMEMKEEGKVIFKRRVMV